jgi:tetratricopeptide (TPR) repeat protein
MTKEQQIKKLLEWGKEKFLKGDYRVAVKIFERILKLDPLSSQALSNLGVIQWQLGNVTSAINIFQKALNFNPNDRDALENLMQAATETSRFDLIDPALLNTVKKAQPANPDFVELINAQQSSAMTT